MTNIELINNIELIKKLTKGDNIDLKKVKLPLDYIPYPLWVSCSKLPQLKEE